MTEMTPSEINTEFKYRVSERLGMLCGAAIPTEEQQRLAEIEAHAWVLQWKEENNSCKAAIVKQQ